MAGIIHEDGDDEQISGAATMLSKQQSFIGLSMEEVRLELLF